MSELENNFTSSIKYEEVLNSMLPYLSPREGFVESSCKTAK